MVMYQVIVGQQEFDPFEGFPTGVVHKTLKGAWREVGDILEGYFQEYLIGSLQIRDIDIDVNAKHVRVLYKRLGFPLEDMFASIYIAKQVAVM